MPLPQIPLDDPRVLALAKARQQFAHDCTHLPTWEELTDKEREGALPDARNYLDAEPVREVGVEFGDFALGEDEVLVAEDDA